MATKFLHFKRLAFFVIALFCALSNRAGTYSSDFTDPAPPGLTLFGSALIAPTGGVNDSGVLELTTIDPPAQTGAAILDDLDNGVAVASFTANFKVRIGGPSASPAFGPTGGPTHGGRSSRKHSGSSYRCAPRQTLDQKDHARRRRDLVD